MGKQGKREFVLTDEGLKICLTIRRRMERRADRAAGRGAIAPEGGETPGLRGDPRERVIRNGSGAFDGTRRNAGLATVDGISIAFPGAGSAQDAPSRSGQGSPAVQGLAVCRMQGAHSDVRRIAQPGEVAGRFSECAESPGLTCPNGNVLHVLRFLSNVFQERNHG